MFRTLSGASKETRIAARFIPKNASKVALKDGSGTVYLYTVADKFGAVGYRGTAGRPEFHHVWKRDADRRRFVSEFFNGLQQSAAYKAGIRAERAAWVNPLTEGTILVSSWGYDQTNVDFYVVTRVSGRRTWIRSIAQEYEATGFMSGKCRAARPVQPMGEDTMHIAQPCGKSASIKISHYYAHPDSGGDHYSSSYA